MSGLDIVCTVLDHSRPSVTKTQDPAVMRAYSSFSQAIAHFITAQGVVE